MASAVKKLDLGLGELIEVAGRRYEVVPDRRGSLVLEQAITPVSQLHAERGWQRTSEEDFRELEFWRVRRLYAYAALTTNAGAGVRRLYRYARQITNAGQTGTATLGGLTTMVPTATRFLSWLCQVTLNVALLRSRSSSATSIRTSIVSPM
jgi:hypothetical protein